jgi:hypothetical protein
MPEESLLVHRVRIQGVHVQGWRNGFAYRLGDFDYPHLHEFDSETFHFNI